MSEWYQVKAKVITQKGTCSAGHKVGDEFIIGDSAPDECAPGHFIHSSRLSPAYNQGAPSPGRRPDKPPSPAGCGKPAGFSINTG